MTLLHWFLAGVPGFLILGLCIARIMDVARRRSDRYDGEADRRSRRARGLRPGGDVAGPRRPVFRLDDHRHAVLNRGNLLL